ncbi:metal ABC transporter ATP-binding protein [Streptococcus sp. ZB199]|nr:metal ABC transporter ATP-binding protein [Streptococcus sp. ZB199]
MIQIEHLSVAYQQTLALEDLSLTIQGPTILGILGPNGAGKSTLIKAMLGLLPIRERSSSIKKISAKFFNEWPTSNRNPLLISTSPSRCGSVSHWVSIPIFLSSSEKAKRTSKKWKMP